jgi:hypothetical protein
MARVLACAKENPEKFMVELLKCLDPMDKGCVSFNEVV